MGSRGQARRVCDACLSARHRRHLAVLLAAFALGSLTVLLALATTTVAVDGAVTSAAIVERALRDDGHDVGLECKGWLNDLFSSLASAAGTSAYLRGGYGDDDYVEHAGGVRIGWRAAGPGDVIQVADFDDPEGGAPLHTAIVLENLGDRTYLVIDSNWVAPRVVGEHLFDPYAYAGRRADVRFYRLGVRAPRASLPHGRLLPPGEGGWTAAGGELSLVGRFGDDVAIAGVTFTVITEEGAAFAGADDHRARNGLWRTSWPIGLAPGQKFVVQAVARDTAGRLGCVTTGLLHTYAPRPRPEGSLLRGRGASVYLLQGGRLRPIPSRAVFATRFRWSQVVRISQAELDMYARGRPLGFRDGSVITTPSRDSTWIISDGRRRPVGVPVLRRLGYTAAAATVVRGRDAASLPLGPAWSAGDGYPDGAVVRDPAGHVFALRAGVKRPIRSLAELLARVDQRETARCRRGALTAYRTGAPLSFPDGWLVSDGTSTWVMQHGRRCAVTRAALAALGYDPRQVARRPSSAVARIAMGPALATLPLRAGGSLLRGSGPEVYQLRDGRRHLVASPAVFASRFRWREVIRVPDWELAAYPHGRPMSFPDGTLLRVRGSDTIYIVSAGRKRAFADRQAFSDLGYRSAAVTTVSPVDAGLVPDGPVVTAGGRHPDGTLVQGGGPQVYWLQAGTKRPIGSRAELTSRFGWDEVVKVSDEELLAYAPGPRLSFPDGRLIAAEGRVYVMVGGQRWHVTTRTVLGALGFGWGAVAEVDDFVVANIPAAQPVSALSLTNGGRLAPLTGPRLAVRAADTSVAGLRWRAAARVL